ncbi:MAG: hypothetical protein ACLR0U_00945 [Enterocloster clostridioformis]
MILWKQEFLLSGEAAVIGAGMPAAVTLTDTGEQVAGTVKAVANQETVLTGGRLVRVVTIQVPNPGGLTTSLKATARIGEFIGSEDGVFEDIGGYHHECGPVPPVWRWNPCW